MRIQHNDDHIRSRLFQKLGIVSILLETGIAQSSNPSNIPEIHKVAQHKILDETSSLEEPLKCQDQSGRTPYATKKSKRIHFDSVVKVVSIPSHAEYSQRIKKVIWSNCEEIRVNAKRNMREFAAEGWKWEQVVEEDGMFLDRSSNTYIHPVHLGGFMAMR